jgi:hypothetical protein
VSTEPAAIQVVRLPGGHEVTVPEGQTPDGVFWRHVAASLSEGLCPVHVAPRDRVNSAVPGMIALHCRECGAYWSFDPGSDGWPVTGGCAWDIDHDPHRFGEPTAPGWLLPG